MTTVRLISCMPEQLQLLRIKIEHTSNTITPITVLLTSKPEQVVEIARKKRLSTLQTQTLSV